MYRFAYTFLIIFKAFVNLNIYIARRKYLKLSDKRVRVMNEIISSMRMIKMYAWEGSFAKRIRELRRQVLDK